MFKKDQIYYCNFDKSYFEYSKLELWSMKHKFNGLRCPYCGRPLEKVN